MAGDMKRRSLIVEGPLAFAMRPFAKQLRLIGRFSIKVEQ